MRHALHSIEYRKMPKVAIPRMAHREDDKPSRVKKACISCKERRVKCDGQQPCRACVSRSILCTYGDAKREAMQKRLADLEQQNAGYRDLLQHLQSTVNSPGRKLIERFLGEYNNAADSPSELACHTHPITSTSNPVWYTDSIEEDFHSDQKLQPIGFVGGHSEIAWIRGLRKDLEVNTPWPEAEAREPVSAKNSSRLRSVCYFLDDQRININDDQPDYQPSAAIANKLLDVYFHVVHATFPIIGKQPFMQQCKVYYSQNRVQPSNKWLAILNLVFAMAARHARLTGQAWASDLYTPEDFFLRAVRLSLKKTLLFDHPDLQQVQIEGLTSFFLMSLSHINRAWRACGMALRSAVALGINLRSESKDTTDSSKEIRYRVWWSLHTLEDTLAIMTGRPSNAASGFSTTPLPVPFDEEQFHISPASTLLSDFKSRSSYLQSLMTRKSAIYNTDNLLKPKVSEKQTRTSGFIHTPNISSYFLYFVNLTSILRSSIDMLYSPRSETKTWSFLTITMVDLLAQTDVWLETLPDLFHFSQITSQLFVRQRWSLAFRFYSTRITISRPSLCRRDRLVAREKDSGTGSLDVAEICINSASAMLSLLPDSPNTLWLIEVSPWWCILHYLVQAITVLLLELEFCRKRQFVTMDRIEPHLNKGLDWLLALSLNDLAAERALAACKDLHARILMNTTVSPVSLSHMHASHSKSSYVSHTGLSFQNAHDSHDSQPLHTSETFAGRIMHPAKVTVHDEYMTGETWIDCTNSV